MRLLIANRYLPALTTLLDGMELKGSQSRARTKLLDLVKDAHLRFGEDEYQLVSEHAVLDEASKPVIEPDGSFTLQNPGEAGIFMEARNQLLASLAEVAGPTYTGHREEIQTLLEEYDQPLVGDQADAYNAIFDAITTQETSQQ